MHIFLDGPGTAGASFFHMNLSIDKAAARVVPLPLLLCLQRKRANTILCAEQRYVWRKGIRVTMKRIAHTEVASDAGEPVSLALGIDQPHMLTFSQAEQLFATHGKTFYFASRFFPQAFRSAVVTLYAFFRLLDDLVDERPDDWQPEVVRQELRSWRTWFQSGLSSPAPREPLGASLATVIRAHQIPVTIFEDFLQGLFSELEPREFANFQELSVYCYQAAGTVGLAMAHLLGTRSQQALVAARHLGIAMQLTNILRDVGGDLARGRIYLPQDDLARFGLSVESLHQLYKEHRGPDKRFQALMRYQVQRAHLAYEAGMHGCWLLPRDCRLPILLAGRLYRRILTQIERQDYDVLRKRAATSLLTKLREAGVALRLVALWKRGEVDLSAKQEVTYEE